jgi:hypothetical protein
VVCSGLIQSFWGFNPIALDFDINTLELILSDGNRYGTGFRLVKFGYQRSAPFEFVL